MSYCLKKIKFKFLCNFESILPLEFVDSEFEDTKEKVSAIREKTEFRFNMIFNYIFLFVFVFSSFLGKKFSRTELFLFTERICE